MNLHDRDNFLRGKKEGITQGAYEKAIETAKKMLKDKLSLETIINYTGLSESIILKLSAE